LFDQLAFAVVLEALLACHPTVRSCGGIARKPLLQSIDFIDLCETARRNPSNPSCTRGPSMSHRCVSAESMAGVLPRSTLSTTNNNKPKRGGARPNAGRKKTAEFRFDPSHARRPELSFKHPVHVMLRTL